MSEYILMNEEQLIKKAVKVLVREFGSVEASRFLSIPQHKRKDSLERHQAWQNTLNKDVFFDDIFSD